MEAVDFESRSAKVPLVPPNHVNGKFQHNRRMKEFFLNKIMTRKKIVFN